RNRIDPPCEWSGIRIVRCEESADRIFRTAHADDHFALCDAWRHRDRVVVLRICDEGFPKRLTRFGIQSFESAIDHGRDDLPLIDRTAAVANGAMALW